MAANRGADSSISGTGFWHWLENPIRRCIDILISGVGMIIFLPAYLLIVLLIKREFHGPATVTEDRVGKDGRTLKIRKFRTEAAAPDQQADLEDQFTDEPRISRFGRFLKDLKLDDLPQLWNVFNGSMSLTGPRPEDPKTIEDLPEDIRQEILSVRPGMTSPSAVLYRNMEDLLSAGSLTERDLRDILPGKLRLDLIYVRNRSLLSDLDMVCWTAATLLPRLRSTWNSYKRLEGSWIGRIIQRPAFWFIVDFFVSLFAIGIAGGLQRLSGPLYIGWEVSIGIGLIIALVYSLCNLVMGLDRIDWENANAGDSLDLAIFDGVVLLLFFIGNRMLPGGVLVPGFVIVASGLFSFAGFVIVRYQLRLFSGLAGRWIALRGHGFDHYGERVLIVGAGEAGRFAINLLRYGPLAQAYNLLGIVDDDSSKWGSLVNGLEVIGSTNEIPGLVFSRDVGLVFFAISEIQPAEIERIIELCRSSGVRVIQLPEVMERLGGHYTRDEGERGVLVGKVLQDTSRDRLTGAYNRQSFIVIMKDEVSDCFRNRQQCALIALEVRYIWPDGAARSRGITAQVLQVVAERAEKHIREIDVLGRYGDNELAILLPRTDPESANRLAERLHRELTATPVWTDRGPLNVNLGFTVLTPHTAHKEASVLLDEVFAEMRRLPRSGVESPTKPISPEPFQFRQNS